ncbi:MAG TPA: transcription termination factor NusA [Bryobacteraceae bacterium]|nr:transcription termination factor NusA [Bryobacteraceae bacterium]
MDSIYQSIEILSKEKGIDAQIVLDAVKDAMLIAARKHFRTVENYEAEFDDKNGIKLYAVKTVADPVIDAAIEISPSDARRLDPQAEIGTIIRIPKPTDALGRISAQTAKQVIFQKVREAERETIYREYADRVGELVNTTIKRVEGLDLVVDLGKTEARLPKREQSRLESYSVGDRVRCVIKIVDKSAKGPGVVVSRADAELVKRLFEQEVPEIYDGTVTIRGCSREAGERTKIAVSSRDRDVDSVGACVGMKGMRVQSIIRELRGEKIDIIEFSDDPVTFATHALSPAKISRVTILDPVEHHMEVIVDDSQLSLAIGKKGQNVRLAAKLLGWKIDIKSEEEKRQEVQNAIEQLSTGAPVSALIDHGLAETTVDALVKGDIGTVERLGSMTPEELEALEGIDEEAVSRIQQAINRFYGQEYAEEPAQDLIQDATAAGELIVGIVEAETAENAEIDANNAGSDPDDRIMETAESLPDGAADGGVEGHSKAESGEEQVS